MTTLEEMGVEVHEMAVSKGWWERPLLERVERLIEWLEEEVKEASEELKHHGFTEWYSIDSEGLEKPEGLGSELADIYLILQDIAHGIGIDLTQAVREKLDYNKIRKYKRDANGL